MHGTAKLAAVAYQHHRVLTGIYTVVSRSPRLQAAAVARELGVSVRTVHRVLSDAGLGFVQVRAIAVAESVTRLRQQQRTQYQSCLGNVVRGLPIGADGYFQGSFTLMLNPCAMLTGLLSLTVLAWHGLNLMRTKAEGDLEERARRWPGALWWAALILALAATAATLTLRRDVLASFGVHPAAWNFPLLVLAGFAMSWRGSNRRSFAGSTLAIIGLLGSAAATLYPVPLPSTVSLSFSLTIVNAASGAHAMLAAWIANVLALCAVAGYTVYVHRAFGGKVRLGPHSY